METKNQFVAFLLTILIAASSALTLPDGPNSNQENLPRLQDALRVVPVYQDQKTLDAAAAAAAAVSTKAQADLCPLCIQFTEQAINQLLNLVLNAGVVETCGKLCNALAQKTGSQLIGAACNILCDIEGVQEFVKIVEKADLDPIYFCEELKTCPIFDGGDAFITKITVTPQSGPQGEKDITFNYMSKNGTGTGEIIVSIRTLDGIPVESGFLEEPKPAGNYSKSLKLKAQPDPDCDPTQQPCEMWEPGNYSLAIAICNGECGSKHPHSKIYDKKESVFVIT